MDTVSSGCGLREIVLRENPDLRESIWIGTTKIDLKEDLSYIGIFLLNRTSEKCHTQQLQTNHTHNCIHAALEDTVETCGMSEVSYRLRKAKLAWMSAYGSRETKQTCMRDFL